MLIKSITSHVVNIFSNIKPSLLVLLLVTPLSACSYNNSDMIDKLNPVNWFENNESEAKDEKNTEKNDNVSSDKYPNLGEVPKRPVSPNIVQNFQKLKSGLVADMEHAQHSDQTLRSQNIPDSSLTLVAAKKLPMPDIADEAPKIVDIDINKNVAKEAVAKEAVAKEAVAKEAVAKEAVAKEKLDNLSNDEPINYKTPDLPASMEPKIIATIYFADGASSLTKLDMSVISQVYDIYKKDGKLIIITGHSSSQKINNDSQQSNMVNFKMSLNRAEAVADEFQSLGVAREKIYIDARGSKQPRYVENNAAGIAGNRRAEIYIGY